MAVSHLVIRSPHSMPRLRLVHWLEVRGGGHWQLTDVGWRCEVRVGVSFLQRLLLPVSGFAVGQDEELDVLIQQLTKAWKSTSQQSAPELQGTRKG